MHSLQAEFLITLLKPPLSREPAVDLSVEPVLPAYYCWFAKHHGQDSGGEF